MPGLDRRLVATLDYQLASERVKADIRSDFILAPHYNAIFNRAGEDAWDQLTQALRSGTYEPNLPITMSVPKERWFTRPGSILEPFDRLAYQAIIDLTADDLEETLDRDRTFSHVPSGENGEIFLPSHQTWQNFQDKVIEVCEDSRFVLKADVSNYFERIPQHHLINLISASGPSSGITNLLEEILLAFQGRNSFGIVQGMYPSDILGNFFLSEVDAYCEILGLPSARYVDDIYIGYQTETDAKIGLHSLIEMLRRDGLHLNEYKTRILDSDEVVREESAIDRLFSEARQEIENNAAVSRASPYGFEVDWEWDDDQEDEDDIEYRINAAAVEHLFENIDGPPSQQDNIEKFCLPLLRSAGSGVALEHVLDNLLAKPHQTRLYLSYVSRFVNDDASISRRLEAIVNSDGYVPDFQRMFLLATLLKSDRIQRNTISTAIQWLQNPQIAKEVRAMSAVFAARRGVATQKRAVRTCYEGEQSDYVRAAILYSSRYFIPAERRTCKRAWGGHNLTNALICNTI